MAHTQYTLEIWGALACFTRPEFKVERVSYEVITPSACRAIFEAIYWKPEIRWQISNHPKYPIFVMIFLLCTFAQK